MLTMLENYLLLRLKIRMKRTELNECKCGKSVVDLIYITASLFAANCKNSLYLWKLGYFQINIILKHYLHTVHTHSKLQDIPNIILEFVGN